MPHICAMSTSSTTDSTIHSVKIFKQINVRNPSFISCNSFKRPRSFITALTDRHQENFPATFSWGEESSSLGATFPGSKQRSQRKVWMFQLWPHPGSERKFWFWGLTQSQVTQILVWTSQFIQFHTISHLILPDSVLEYLFLNNPGLLKGNHIVHVNVATCYLSIFIQPAGTCIGCMKLLHHAIFHHVRSQTCYSHFGSITSHGKSHQLRLGISELSVISGIRCIAEEALKLRLFSSYPLETWDRRACLLFGGFRMHNWLMFFDNSQEQPGHSATPSHHSPQFTIPHCLAHLLVPQPPRGFASYRSWNCQV